MLSLKCKHAIPGLGPLLRQTDGYLCKVTLLKKKRKKENIRLVLRYVCVRECVSVRERICLNFGGHLWAQEIVEKRKLESACACFLSKRVVQESLGQKWGMLCP